MELGCDDDILLVNAELGSVDEICGVGAVSGGGCCDNVGAGDGAGGTGLAITESVTELLLLLLFNVILFILLTNELL